MVRGSVRGVFTLTVLSVATAVAQPVVPAVPPASTNPPLLPFPPENRGHWDRVAVPLDQVADTIVIIVPDAAFDLVIPTPHERVIRGSIVRLEKGRAPVTIVHRPNTFVTSLQAGVPTRLFLSKFDDRDAYYIIGVIALPTAERP